MKLLKNLVYSRPVQQYLYKQGFLLREDVIKNELFSPLKPEDKNYLNKTLLELQDTNLYKDVNQVIQKVNTLNNHFTKSYNNSPLNEREKSFSYLNNLGAVGYEPAGSILKKLYPAPFAPYAFIADNYWAADKARGEIRSEIERDGWVLVADENVSKKSIKALYEILEQLHINRLWTDWADTLNVFGNVWNKVDENKFGGLKPGAIEMLLPERIIPVLDVWNENVIYWDYQYQGKMYRFPLGALDHFMTYSTRSRQMGSPALTSEIVEIEADMQAAVYNNTVIQKGGLIKGILSLSMPDQDSQINDSAYMEYAAKVQDLINKKFSGLRGAYQLAVMFGADKYHDLNKLNEIDGINQKSTDRTAARTAMLIGCPPEKLSLRTYSQYQNTQSTTDTIAVSLDNKVYYLTSKVAEYINKEIIQRRLKINNIKIQAKGEFGSLSTTVAQFGKLIAEMKAKAITVDEFRVRGLHWDKHPDPKIGASYIGDVEEMEVTQGAVGPAAKYLIDGKAIIRHLPEQIIYY